MTSEVALVRQPCKEIWAHKGVSILATVQKNRKMRSSATTRVHHVETIAYAVYPGFAGFLLRLTAEMVPRSKNLLDQPTLEGESIS
jgi:hypothetical protein